MLQKTENIRLFSEALKAVSSIIMKSKLIWDCVRFLNELTVHNQLILCWIPGHSDIRENEKLDKHAYIGNARTPLGKVIACALSSENAKTALNDG